ncbi:MAG: hypothetical protein WA152_03135 [Microgenomates group bacterium]
MTIEYKDYQVQVEERIKQVIARWTGLPSPAYLGELNEKLGDANIGATRPYFEKEARSIYKAVDYSATIARRLRLIK